MGMVPSYLEEWQLSVNSSKSEMIHLGHANQRYDYTIGTGDLRAKHSCRDLGVKVSDDNKFTQHITEIVRTAYHRLKQLRISFSCKDKDFQIYLYSTFIRPILEYNTFVWSPYLLKDIDKVERVQKMFTRHLPSIRGLPYLSRLRNLKLQSLEERRIIFDMILVFKVIHGLVSIRFDDLFVLNRNNTRGHAYKLCTQFSRVNYRNFFFPIELYQYGIIYLVLL